MIRYIFNKTGSFLKQNEGLGHLQVYNLLKTASLVVTSIVFAKFIINPLTINNWETLLLLGSVYSFFYVSGLGYTLVSFVKKYKETEWPVIFKSTFMLLFILSIISSAAIVITGFWFKSISFPLMELLLFCVYMIGTICSTVIEYIYFINKSFKKLMTWGLINFIVFILAPTIPLLMGYGFIYSLSFMAAFGLLKFLVALGLIHKPFSFVQLQYIRPLLIFNWPVILSLLLGTGCFYIANFIIKAEVDIHDFNIFRYGSREFPLFLVMANSFSIVLGGSAFNAFANNEFWSDIRRSHLRLMHQLFSVACILMLFSEDIFEWAFTKEFIPSYQVFNIMLLTLIARVLFPQSLLMGKGKTRYAFFSSLAEFMVGVTLVIVLTSAYGIIGATWGICLAYFLEKMILIACCYREKIGFHKSLDLKWFLAYSILLILCFLFANQY